MLEQKELGNNEGFKDTELCRNVRWHITTNSSSSGASEHSLLISTDTYTHKFKKLDMEFSLEDLFLVHASHCPFLRKPG